MFSCIRHDAQTDDRPGAALRIRLRYYCLRKAESQVGIDLVIIRREPDALEVPSSRYVPVGAEIGRKKDHFEQMPAKRGRDRTCPYAYQRQFAAAKLGDHRPFEQAVGAPAQKAVSVRQQPGSRNDEHVRAPEPQKALYPLIGFT